MVSYFRFIMDVMNVNQAIPLAEAAALFPRRNGKKVHVLTLKRRVIDGCRGVKLRAFKSGGIWYTTPQWVQEFEDECTRHALHGHGELPQRSATEQAEASHRAKETLRRRFGIDVEQEANKCGRRAKALEA
jgi:hypothetical protein